MFGGHSLAAQVPRGCQARLSNGVCAALAVACSDMTLRPRSCKHPQGTWPILGQWHTRAVKRAGIPLAVIGVAFLVAMIYVGFEQSVDHGITLVWDTLFDTNNKRMLVVPLCVVLGLVFFAGQHLLDPDSEAQESHGIVGAVVQPRLSDLGLVLLLGFLSLESGASLGPEAVLVPASLVIAAYLASKFFAGDERSRGALASAALVALFAAFFHSFVIGVAAIFLLAKQAQVKISAPLLLLAGLSSASALITLSIFYPKDSFFNWPSGGWKIAFADVGVAALLAVAGFATTYLLDRVHTVFRVIREHSLMNTWWRRALVAGLGLGLLFLLGGTLVEFTGNLSIKPMLQQSASLGIAGLAGIYLVKVAAIAWSKAWGYRGGMIFPTLFVASVLVAMATLVRPDTNLTIALIGAMVGVGFAERRVKILV